MPDGTTAAAPAERRIFDHLPPHVLAGLTAEQRCAIAAAANEPAWADHPVNIRISLPIPFVRYYMTFVAGPERRGNERRDDERRRNPIATKGNLVFVVAAAAAFYMAAAVIMPGL